jgi:hypothetical protein
MDKDPQREQSVPREDISYLTIGKTTYEIASVYDGKSTLLDLVKSSLERSAQQALRTMKNPCFPQEKRGVVDENTAAE